MSTCHPGSRRSVATARWSRSPATRSTLPRSPPNGQTCCAWPGRWSPTRSAPSTCCGCSAATDTPPLGEAFIGYGRSGKTLHLFALVEPIDGSYQRRMNRQLTVQESRHRLGRKICHGHRGQIRQAYREGQEDQLAALGLVLNAVGLWNTRYLDAIVESLRGSGQPVRDEDAARLSPLGHAHLNCLGRYAFTTQPPAELRPLRDPNARDGEDDGEF